MSAGLLESATIINDLIRYSCKESKKTDSFKYYNSNGNYKIKDENVNINDS